MIRNKITPFKLPVPIEYSFESLDGFDMLDMVFPDVLVDIIPTENSDLINPPWKSDFIADLQKLAKLSMNWDGDGAKPFSNSVIEFTVLLMAAICVPNLKFKPEIVPGTNGDLQLEWHGKKYHVDMHILDVERVVAIRTNLDVPTSRFDERHEFIKITNDFAVIKNWMKELFNNIPIFTPYENNFTEGRIVINQSNAPRVTNKHSKFLIGSDVF